MNKKFKKILTLSSILLVLVLTITACNKPVDNNKTTPLVVGYSEFSEKFSPFFAKTGYDMDAVSMTQVSLMVLTESEVSFTNQLKEKQFLITELTIHTLVSVI